MLADQTDFAVPTSVPGSIDAYLGYGIGAWIERRDDAGNPVEFSSPGAFGTTPWIDLENEYFGVFLIDDALANIDGGIDNVRAFAAARIDAAPDLAGDADRDGDVDLADFGLLRASFGTVPGRYLAGDLDGDADVDLADFGILRANFGEADLEPLDAWHATLIPEPAAGVGLLLVAARRAARRRNMR